MSDLTLACFTDMEIEFRGDFGKGIETQIQNLPAKSNGEMFRKTSVCCESELVMKIVEIV